MDLPDNNWREASEDLLWAKRYLVPLAMRQITARNKMQRQAKRPGAEPVRGLLVDTGAAHRQPRAEPRRLEGPEPAVLPAVHRALPDQDQAELIL